MKIFTLAVVGTLFLLWWGMLPAQAADGDPETHLDHWFGFAPADRATRYEISCKMRGLDADGNEGLVSGSSEWIPIEAHPVPEPGQDFYLLAGLAELALIFGIKPRRRAVRRLM